MMALRVTTPWARRKHLNYHPCGLVQFRGHAEDLRTIGNRLGASKVARMRNPIAGVITRACFSTNSIIALVAQAPVGRALLARPLSKWTRAYARRRGAS